jgi:hypothetical protein
VTTNCVKVSGTWRKVNSGVVKNAGSWRYYIKPLGINDFGGRIVCVSNSTIWIVAPSTSEVNRTWNFRTDAVTRANTVSGSCGWFIPSRDELRNAGWPCRSFWDTCQTNTYYWSNTERNGPRAFSPIFYGNYGPTSGCCYREKTDTLPVRAFRCVTY